MGLDPKEEMIKKAHEFSEDLISSWTDWVKTRLADDNVSIDSDDEGFIRYFIEYMLMIKIDFSKDFPGLISLATRDSRDLMAHVFLVVKETLSICKNIKEKRGTIES